MGSSRTARQTPTSFEATEAATPVDEVDRIAASLQGAQRILVTTHPHPDGDAAGSLSAALQALFALGKDAVGYNPDPIPQRFRFMRCLDGVLQELPKGDFDLTLVLDCTDERMFGGDAPKERLGTVVALDHHKTEGDFAELILRDPDAASAGVVLHRVLERLEVPLDLPMAEALYCSLISDTGSFRYQNTNPEAMRLGAKLLEVGVDPWRVASNLYESQSRGQLELLGEVLRTLEVCADGRLAILEVTHEMMAHHGCNKGHVDGFINYGRGIEGVEVAALLRVGPSDLRVSLRSRGQVDVSALAARFGGGGHHNAAGFTVEAGARDRIVAELVEAAGQVCSQKGQGRG